MADLPYPSVTETTVPRTTVTTPVSPQPLPLRRRARCGGHCAGPATALPWTRPKPACCYRPGGTDLDDLCRSAARVRDQGLVSAGSPRSHHLFEEGLHPADPAVPGPLPLLHVRHHARSRARALPLRR